MTNEQVEQIKSCGVDVERLERGAFYKVEIQRRVSDDTMCEFSKALGGIAESVGFQFVLSNQYAKIERAAEHPTQGRVNQAVDVSRFRKKPVEIDALLWNGSNVAAVREFFGGFSDWHFDICELLVIKTLEGNMMANPGDWIIKGLKGEFYPIKPDIFAISYDAVESV